MTGRRRRIKPEPLKQQFVETAGWPLLAIINGSLHDKLVAERGEYLPSRQCNARIISIVFVRL